MSCECGYPDCSMNGVSKFPCIYVRRTAHGEPKPKAVKPQRKVVVEQMALPEGTGKFLLLVVVVLVIGINSFIK